MEKKQRTANSGFKKLGGLGLIKSLFCTFELGA
jgi:hypothetical protein